MRVSGTPPAIEELCCRKGGCAVAYTLYSDDPLSMHGSETSLDVMRRMGIAKIEGDHQLHVTKIYYWKGPALGWLEADTMAQRKAL
jgi:hypothetical protein